MLARRIIALATTIEVIIFARRRSHGCGTAL
jgi:hypothetical protein